MGFVPFGQREGRVPEGFAVLSLCVSGAVEASQLGGELELSWAVLMLLGGQSGVFFFPLGEHPKNEAMNGAMGVTLGQLSSGLAR